MKARVKATGEIVDIAYTYKTVGKNPISKCETLEGKRYNEDDLDFNIEDDNTPDYWTRLEHQYAGMAMQGLMSYVEQITPKEGRSYCDEIVDISFKVAHSLVQKLKEKEEK